MQGFKIEIIGACIAMAIGFVLLMAMTFLAPLRGLLSPDPADQPLIHVGISGAIYSLVVLGLGIFGFWNAKWGGLGLVAFAVIGFLFAFKSPAVPLILLVAAGFCLGGWYRAERMKSHDSGAS